MKKTAHMKFVSLLTILTMLVAMLVGCGTDTASNAAVSASAETAAVVSNGEPAGTETSAAEADVSEEVSSEEAPVETADGIELDSFDWGVVELPIVEEPVTLTYFFTAQPFMMMYAGEVEYEDLTFYREMEERTGIHMDITAVDMMSGTEKFNLMIASGNYTDLMEGIGTYTGGADQAINDEVILSLNDIMDDWMPNYKKWLDSNVNYKNTVTSAGGNVYTAAYLLVDDVGLGFGPQLRQDWLDEADLDLPVTYDDLHDVLTAFKDNGHPNALWMTSGLYTPGNCWSGGYGALSDGAFCLAEDGETVIYPYADESYRAYLEMLNQWWNEGLIYADFVSIDPSEDYIDTGLVLSDAVGVWGGDITTLESMEADATTEGFDISPFTCPVQEEGDIIHISSYIQYTKGGASIATTCANVEAAAKWMDYLYTYDGYLLANYGIEGEALQYNEEGKPELTDLVLHATDYITPQGIVLFTKYGGPGICDAQREYRDYTDEEWDILEVWNTNRDGDHMLPFDSILTGEESAEQDIIMSDIKTAAEEAILQFVIGDRDLAEWDEYVAGLKAMNLDRAVEIQQIAWDRYVGK